MGPRCQIQHQADGDHAGSPSSRCSMYLAEWRWASFMPEKGGGTGGHHVDPPPCLILLFFFAQQRREGWKGWVAPSIVLKITFLVLRRNKEKDGRSGLRHVCDRRLLGRVLVSYVAKAGFKM